MDKTWHQALNYEALVRVCNNSEAKAQEAFAKILGSVDTTEPLLLHLRDYASLLGREEDLFSRAYYECRSAFEVMDLSLIHI